MKPSTTIPLAILLGGVIVAAAVYFSVHRSEPSTSSGQGDPAAVRPVGPADHILGNPAAPVKIVEYADFDCEYCKNFSATLHAIIANEGANGAVDWVFREFPIMELHPTAEQDAEAAECASKVGGNEAFWKFADLLFANQPADPQDYGTYAARAGISSDTFATCLADASSTVDARIAADRSNALAAGAQGTPYSLILVAGQPPIVMDGAYSYEAVKQLVDHALQSLDH